MLTAWPCAFALNPAWDLSQYAHTAWRIREGFTEGSINAIAQTSDGYLWLGTAFGLVRFDGVRAVPWQPPAGEQLPDNRIHDLLVARDGTLWIATDKGLASWKEGKLVMYPKIAGRSTFPLLEDHEGTVWFGVSAPSRLCAIRGANVECYGGERLGPFVSGLYEDHEHNLWVSAATGLWRWKPGPPQHYIFPRNVVSADALIEGHDNGPLLLATNDGLKQLVSGKIENYALPAIAGQFRPSRLFRSRDGSLWVGTYEGLLHFYEGRTSMLSTADNLAGDIVTGILEDHEGNVWVASLNGLDRFRDYAVPGISSAQGLSITDAYSVQAMPDGSVWIGTADRLNRWVNGHVTVYGKGIAKRATRDKRELQTEVATRGLMGTPGSLGKDERDRLWVSTRSGIFYFEADRFIRVPDVPGHEVTSIAGDGRGVWISQFRGGLFYVRPGKAVQRFPLLQLGQKSEEVTALTALLPDHLQGGVWLGLRAGGVVYFKDGKVRASYTSADGLGSGKV
jgi:ligand-binding sensor domain-containing protein